MGSTLASSPAAGPSNYQSPSPAPSTIRPPSRAPSVEGDLPDYPPPPHRTRGHDPTDGYFADLLGIPQHDEECNLDGSDYDEDFDEDGAERPLEPEPRPEVEPKPDPRDCVLFTDKVSANRTRRRVSFKTFPSASLIAWIRRMLSQDGFPELMQVWRWPEDKNLGLPITPEQ